MEEKADFSGACQNEVLPKITEKLGLLTFDSTEEPTTQQPHFCKLCQCEKSECHKMTHMTSSKSSLLSVGIHTLPGFDNLRHRTYKKKNFLRTHPHTHAGEISHEPNVHHTTCSRNSVFRPGRVEGRMTGIMYEFHKKFPRLRASEEHCRIPISKKSGICNICCSTFMRSCSFGVHLHRGKLIHECTVCHRTFQGRHALEAHICTQTKKKSDVRKIAFFKLGNSKENVCTHTGEKSHQCKVCLKKCLKQGELKDPVHECNVCHKRFLSRSILKAHRATHSGEKHFVCNVCHKDFSCSSALALHRSIHGVKNAFICDVCHEEFPNCSILNDHRATHTVENPYVCDVCLGEFPSYSILNDHCATHAGENPYVCDVCSEAFSSNEHLNAHLCIQALENMCL